MPQVHTTIASFRSVLDRERVSGWTVGFVPTMGYLHDGHASLMRAAAEECDLVAASIFVNPLQFAATEDLSDYPRDLDRDLAITEDAGVAHVLVPSVEEMYPTPILTQVTVAGITARFEGAARPEHFAGVATVVAKLLSISGPCRAYFGEKDFQQLAVVRRMARDLSMPVEVVGCPIVREDDGLAMSSRNVYLSAAQRDAAPVLHRSLCAAAGAVAAGERSVAAVEAIVADAIAAEPEAELDYAALVDAATLEPASTVAGTQRLLVAARFGATRLLDNTAIET
ncbi:pantoate--beta-alanine ligase [Aquihabitans daechungensis]|uniref:pantoate--beta-alanine ligase n=1 Tax=Aquihabitans daechungensis TaxID=1052257 RepID=UPI003B9E667A